MSRSRTRSSKKKTVTIAVLVACLLLAAIGGTIAWLTTQDSLTNSFTAGKIDPVDPGDDGPDDKPIPDEIEDPDIDKKLSSNLYEPSWDPDSKLMPAVSIAKDPYVGVGAGSEPAYVYVYVTNSMVNNNHVYFAINDGWSAVENKTKSVLVGGETMYISGLFKYNAGLDASDATGNDWTEKALFDEIVVSENADQLDFRESDGTTVGKIVVQAYLHQMYKDADQSQDLETEAEEAALTYFELN